MNALSPGVWGLRNTELEIFTIGGGFGDYIYFMLDKHELLFTGKRTYFTPFKRYLLYLYLLRKCLLCDQPSPFSTVKERVGGGSHKCCETPLP